MALLAYHSWAEPTPGPAPQNSFAMPKTIITDSQLLTELRKAQIRRQVPPLALLAISFLVSFLLPLLLFHYPSMVIAITSVIWFRVVAATFRCKHQIAVPDGDLLLSPITGKVRSIKSAPDYTLVRISKSMIDYVEIRSPHDSAEWEGDTLKLKYKGHNLIFRFETNSIKRIESADMQAGNIIGYIIGSAVCSVSIPRELSIAMKPKELCDAGLSVIVSE